MRLLKFPSFAFALGLLIVTGCSDSEEVVPGRVAVDVTLTIDGQPAESGTLVLRPGSNVACPLVKLTISEGKGSLSSIAGPVPGQWTATFRSDSEGSLTDQLEGKGRANPANQIGGGFNSNGNSKAATPPKSISIVIPKTDPAVVAIKISRS